MARIFCDVVIIGGGATGCMAAIGAKNADPDLDVVVVEPHASGRHRIGEALLTGTVMTLDDAGLAEEVASAGFHKKIGATYVWGKSRDPWYVNYPKEHNVDYPDAFKNQNGERHTIHVPRHIYDAFLARLVEARGVRFIRQSVNGVEAADTAYGPEIRHITLDNGDRVIAKEYIDASGQASFLGRRLTKRLPVGTPKIARYAYTAHVDWERASDAGFDIHRTNIVSDKNGWIWIIHLGDAAGGLTSFGFVSTPDVLSKLTLENCCEAFPETEKFGFRRDKGYTEPRTFDNKSADQFYGHPDYSFSCQDLDGPNWSLAGDAAVFIDPILSQGVTLGSHYGHLRGKASAARIHENDQAHVNVTQHYRNEAAIMHDVVGMWYSNNRSMEGWTLKATEQAKTIYGLDLSPEKAFRWITNLENIRDEYDPYPATERNSIKKNLGV